MKVSHSLGVQISIYILYSFPDIDGSLLSMTTLSQYRFLSPRCVINKIPLRMMNEVNVKKIEDDEIGNIDGD